MKSQGEIDGRSYASLRPGGLARNSFSQPIDNAGDAVLDQSHIEIDEQAKTFVGQSKIGQKLFFVDRGNQVDGFEQAWAERRVDAEGGGADLLGYGVLVHISFR